jgi:uncharacterized protein (TIRG00374 family)
MTDLKPDKSNIRLILGILISLVALALLLWLVDGRQVLAALKGINPITVILVLFMLVISLLTRAAAWRIILKERITLSQSFFFINIGYFVNTVLPFRIGEITRAFLLLPAGFSFWEALPSILLERIIDFIYVLVIFFSTLPLALDFPLSIQSVYILVGVLAASLAFLIFIYHFRERVLRWIGNLSFLGEKLKERITSLFNSVVSSLVIISEPVRFAKVLTLMVISWVIALGIQFTLLRAFLPDAKFFWAAFALSVVSLGISIPSSPGNIGVYEASLTLALSAFGVDQSLAFAYALTSHVLSLLVTTLLGSYGLIREGFALRDIWQFRVKQTKDTTYE